MLALLFGLSPLYANATSAPEVVISEIAWAGSSTSTADEWIEFTNISDHDVDVSGWNLIGASTAPITFPAGSLIASHATFLIANYANTSTSSTLNSLAQVVTTMVSIPNDKLTITLTTAAGSLVDSAGNGGASFAGKSGGTGSTIDGRFRSMERRDFSIDGATKEAWIDADTSLGFKTSATDYGTPGNLNPFFETVFASQQPVVIQAPVVDTTLVSTPTTTEPEQLCTDILADTATLPPDPVVTSVVTEPVTAAPNSTTSVVDVAQTTSATSTADTSATQNQTQQGTLRVSEIFPHPETGAAEWIELENTSIYPVSTNGWSVLDASGAATLLPDGIVNPGSFLVIENPKGKLNNDGDSVVVKDANGSIIDSVMYNADLGSVPNLNESLIRENTNTLSITTTPTKNTSNNLTPRTSTSTSTINAPTSTNTSTVDAIATNSGTTLTPPPASTVSTTPITSPPSPKTLRLSEIYPNTGGNDLLDEFIELENTGDQDISLEGWLLTDASGTTFTFAKDSLIAAHTFKAFLHPETKISLNNTGDSLTLTAPDKSVVDTQTYEQTKALSTYARTNDVWTWTTTRTPNEPNVVSGNSDPISTATPPEPTATTNPSPTTQSVGTISASVLTIEEAKLNADGTRVKIRGVVTALPNTFNSQTMYVQDDTGGIQIFKSDCRFPTLLLGQAITVTGVLSHVNGEARLKVMNQTSLLVGSAVAAITPATDTSSVGSLITIAGVVMSHSGNRLALNVDGETMNVDLPKINTAVYRNGSNIQVSGILAKTKSGTVVKARSSEDIVPMKQDKVEQSVPNVSSIGSAEPKQTLAIVLIAFASLAFLGLKLRPQLYALINSYGRKQPLAPRA